MRLLLGSPRGLPLRKASMREASSLDGVWIAGVARLGGGVWLALEVELSEVGVEGTILLHEDQHVVDRISSGLPAETGTAAKAISPAAAVRPATSRAGPRIDKHLPPCIELAEWHRQRRPSGLDVG